ncbi:SDR family oxidoreductase [Aureimonas jatrophae]|uniref:NADP-dependent 3-hydroxy acid dehydrogenase YdfG n=1 Tax=Aureimonas jatrophae TaxID=1166073 RepID=A0A1H0FC30_9HYPH|nr:SDR family oxidoreductase [Aureimonas jatrophae]MBB3950081.1 NADP-dependent 3-hydroxy acid dehydrogenase YdfG [Aureimonas jatrophae]SDN92277.1 NADP-dependent 3-hydroxy acid dehydrogenase YdfG [Aureimonas jatrophae]
MTIANRIVAVTGAGRGIGRATALHLASRGVCLVLGARSETEIAAVAAEIEAAGGHAAFQRVDVTRRADLDGLVGLARDRFGRLDAIVNNAGVGPISRFDALRVEDWEAMIDINLKGALYGIAAALPLFRTQGNGHVVNVVSTAGLKIVPTMGVYAATKNALRTATEALRQECVPGLRVTEVSPGFIDTTFVDDSITDPAVRDAINRRKRELAISPDAVARAIAFALEQPADVEIGSIVVRPTAQD